MSADGPRVAIVTGAGSGIGRAAAERLRKDGVTVVGLGRRLPSSPTTRSCDVRDEATVARVIAEVTREHGRLDILVNCAGVAVAAGPLEVTLEQWEEMLRTNLIGTYWCCKHAVLAMRPRRYGRIVNVGSIAGRSFSRTASVAYTCSKYAVIGLTRQLAASVAADGITVNCVCPSQTRTEMLAAVPAAQLEAVAAAVPIGRLAEPEEVAEAIAFLTGEAAGYVNGAVLDVNGGQL